MRSSAEGYAGAERGSGSASVFTEANARLHLHAERSAVCQVQAVVGRVLSITARIIYFKVELEQTLPTWPFGQIPPPSNRG